MSGRARFSVPGEEVPGFVTVAIGVLGLSSAGFAGFGLSPGGLSQSLPPRAAGAASSVAREVVAVPKPVESVQADGQITPKPTGPSEPGIAAKPTKCPALVVTFARAMPSPPKSASEPLAKLGHWLTEHPDVVVVLDGHADSVGSEDENLWLSRQRAAGVRIVLERAGVPRARITARAFGSFLPADEAPPDASWNRRVVVQTKGQSCPREAEEVVVP